MLSLRFSTDDYAFVYTEGRPIGAILVGETKGRTQFSLLFSGRETDFEILRPRAVERRLAGKNWRSCSCGSSAQPKSGAIGVALPESRSGSQLRFHAR